MIFFSSYRSQVISCFFVNNFIDNLNIRFKKKHGEKNTLSTFKNHAFNAIKFT